jgi:hypothetical protein
MSAEAAELLLTVRAAATLASEQLARIALERQGELETSLDLLRRLDRVGDGLAEGRPALDAAQEIVGIVEQVGQAARRSLIPRELRPTFEALLAGVPAQG